MNGCLLWYSVVGIVLLLCTLQGLAEGGTGREQALAPKPRALPAAAAVVPGLLVHGAGHFAMGERDTAYTLLKGEAVGLGAFAGGAAGLALTGASRHMVSLFALTTMAGVGLLATTWLADLYGVLAPRGGTGLPLRQLPWLQASLGVKSIRDPTLSGNFALGSSVQLWHARWRASSALWAATNGDAKRFEALAAYRVTGPTPTGQWATGSFVDIELGGFHHRYQESGALAFPSRFRITGAEAKLQARLDLATIAATLQGAFVEGAAGVGIAAYRYPDVSATEANTTLLGGFAFGLYIGRRADRWAQARVFYNHRHDDFVGGLKTYGLGSGALGYFGTDVHAYFTKRWGALVDVSAGAAFVSTLSLLYRYGQVSL